MHHLTLGLQDVADTQVKAAAAGQFSLQGGPIGPMDKPVDKPEASVEQALIFGKEAAALEMFPVWSVFEGIEDDALMQPWFIRSTVWTAYSGRAALKQHWDIRCFDQVVQAVPVHVTDRQRLLTREF